MSLMEFIENEIDAKITELEGNNFLFKNKNIISYLENLDTVKLQKSLDGDGHFDFINTINNVHSRIQDILYNDYTDIAEAVWKENDWFISSEYSKLNEEAIQLEKAQGFDFFIDQAIDEVMTEIFGYAAEFYGEDFTDFKEKWQNNKKKDERTD